MFRIIFNLTKLNHLAQIIACVLCKALTGMTSHDFERVPLPINDDVFHHFSMQNRKQEVIFMDELNNAHYFFSRSLSGGLS
jgi:hypothetical protein